MPTWTVKDYVDDAARECSISPPVNWLTATDATALQFRTFLKDVVRELLQRHDWSAVSADYTFSGAGGSFALPDDFLRVQEDENSIYETTPNRRRVLPMPRRGDWTETEEWNWTGVQRYFRLQGSTIEFLSSLPSGASVTMAYVQTTWIEENGGTRSATWDAVDDESLIPGHLILLGLVWRWRRHKGLVYADRKAEYESELARAIGDDAPRRKVDTTGPSIDVRHPMRVPVPDFIPSS